MDRDCENCIHKVNGACNSWGCKFEPKRGMTKEVAIRYCDEYLARHISDIDKEFLKKAKEALEQEPCDKCVYSTSEGCQYDDITETIPPFESENAISKQAVFEQIGGWITSGEYEFTNATDYLCKRINSLPPVTPQPKMGHWIFDEILDKHYYCSECKSMGVNYWDFCPNCGAKMVEPQESEDKE